MTWKMAASSSSPLRPALKPLQLVACGEPPAYPGIDSVIQRNKCTDWSGLTESWAHPWGQERHKNPTVCYSEESNPEPKKMVGNRVIDTTKAYICSL